MTKSTVLGGSKTDGLFIPFSWESTQPPSEPRLKVNSVILCTEHFSFARWLPGRVGDLLAKGASDLFFLLLDSDSEVRAENGSCVSIVLSASTVGSISLYGLITQIPEMK